MPYLFEPPTITVKTVMHGRALVYGYTVSETVWKDANGVWHSQLTPPTETLNAASELLAVSGRPQIVDDTTAADLIAAGIGTCTQIT